MDAKSVIMKKYSGDVINIEMKLNAKDFTPELGVLLQSLFEGVRVMKRETKLIFTKRRIKITVELSNAFAAEVIKTSDGFTFNAQPVTDVSLLRIIMDFTARKNISIVGSFSGFKTVVDFIVSATNTSLDELELPAAAINESPVAVPVNFECSALTEENGGADDVLISKKIYALIVDINGNVITPENDATGKPCWRVVESVNNFYISRAFTTVKNKHHAIAREDIGTIEQVPSLNNEAGVLNGTYVPSDESLTAYANFLALNNIDSIEQYSLFQA